MNEFIQQVASSLGTDESTARSATGGLLQFVKSQIGASDFSQLTDKLPGAAGLLEAAPQAGEQGAGGGGMLGGLMGKAAGAVGGDLGSAAGLAGQLKASGLDLSKAGSFVAMFVEFVKQKAGPGLSGRILDQVPELKKLLG